MTLISSSHLLSFWLWLLASYSLLFSVSASSENESHIKDFYGRGNASTHTNNWAVLVCSSRYWFNYRHMANALGMYRTVKRLGIPDSNIILMLADDAACNSRNKFPASVYANPGRHLDLYGGNIEVDYRGYEVTVENFLRVLTGRVDESVPRSKRLLTDRNSNIFIFMTGHGGNEFLKFQDNEEISAHDIADAFEQMWQGGRYNEIFFMIDTCEANTMYSKFYSPNILATGSSFEGESSYSHENDNDIGVAVIDSYTHYVLQYMEGVNKTSKLTMGDLFTSYDVPKIGSHPGVRSDLFQRPLGGEAMLRYGQGEGWRKPGEWTGREMERSKRGREALITDFFGGVADVDIGGENAETEEVTGSQASQSSEEASSERLQPLKYASHLGDEFSKGLPSARAWASFLLIGVVIGVIEASLHGVAQGASGKAGGLVAKWAYPSELVKVSFPEHVKLANEHNGKERWGFRYTQCGSWEGTGRVSREQSGKRVEKSLEKTLGLEDGVRSTAGESKSRRKKGLPEDLLWVEEHLTEGYSPMAPDGHTAQVHPYLFTTSMMELAKEKGVELVQGRVTSIIRDDGKVTGVEYEKPGSTEKETVSATDVILTAGAWSPSLVPSLPIDGSRAHSITIHPDPSVMISAYALFTSIELPTGDSVTPEIYARPGNELYACSGADDCPLPDTVDGVQVDLETCEALQRN
ncbi:glycosylphosphatidylinositol anchor biosynthesis, partial [Marasmius crinis-equi]